MKKILLFITVLMLSLGLTGCIEADNADLEHGHQELDIMYDRMGPGMMGPDADSTYPETGMMYPYYYGEVWDTCTINGVEYTNVSIIYTSLGLAYQVEKNADGAFTRVFMPDLLIEHCEVEIPPLDLGGQ